LGREDQEEALRKLKEAQEDATFPDEVDTPLHRPARERFEKYRGLQSFKTSAWDPKVRKDTHELSLLVLG
jgi:pre-rRNA-processing protein TSR1